VTNENVWKKKSIFFRLPYQKDNFLRHNLDVMHIKKNVMDKIVGTLLDIKGKTKDNFEACKDLQEMGLRLILHPFTENEKTYKPPTHHTMSLEDKSNFLKMLRDVRVPDGYASNIFRCVRLKERIILGLKSHDSYILMQQLLPIALRGSNLPSNVVMPLVGMCTFFRGICSTTLAPKDLNRFESGVIVTLCQMEQVFSPNFFTSMVHIVVHLVCECRLGGPVQYRWMYPGER
jgi:hypothetical protein